MAFPWLANFFHKRTKNMNREHNHSPFIWLTTPNPTKKRRISSTRSEWEARVKKVIIKAEQNHRGLPPLSEHHRFFSKTFFYCWRKTVHFIINITFFSQLTAYTQKYRGFELGGWYNNAHWWWLRPFVCLRAQKSLCFCCGARSAAALVDRQLLGRTLVSFVLRYC